ncbi:MAG: enoyl-CoA hydratase/isomerase family protein [Gammaproteobacteria bacterium]
MNKPILFEEYPGKDGKIGVITLNRPEALNALTLPMCVALEQQLSIWEEEDAIKAVVIQGAGQRGFCAGGDLRVLYETKSEQVVKAKQFFCQEYRADWRVFNFPKPYIALLHGIVMGGGVGISIPGSHRLVAEDLVWAMPETGIGIFPDVGTSYFLIRCPGKTGLYLGLTGTRLGAADAVALGFADAIMPRNQFAAFFDTLLATSLGDKPYSVITELMQQFVISTEPPKLSAQQKIINKCFAASSVEGIIQGLQQQPQEWAQQTAATLLKRSPTSLKVTYRLLQPGKKLDYGDCLRTDYRLANRFLVHPDFLEGIRAALIDKDLQPHWSPNHLQQITEQDVAAFFAPLEQELVLE